MPDAAASSAAAEAAPLLEAVPNVSEGRRREVLDRLIASAAAGGAHLLHVTSDPDHNRSVLTLAGAAEPLRAALLALFETAVAEIDLRTQRGVHPRVGAVDVVPVVPLAGATMSDAVSCAAALGAEIARRFQVPVWLYEAAATAPARRALPDVRRGGFERLAQRLAKPEWRPDFGPARPHPSAGAAIVGARFFLVAYNVVLESADPALARAVARAVRASSGGLPALRAIGVPLPSRGLVQVSMNLLDYRVTSIATAFAAVAAAAAALGAAVRESELIGLAPRAALPAAPEAVLLALRPEQILEDRLAAAGLPNELPEGLPGWAG